MAVIRDLNSTVEGVEAHGGLFQAEHVRYAC